MKKGYLIATLLLVALLLFPLATDKDYLLHMVLLVCLYFIHSSSWNIFGGYCGQISLGHAAFFGAGALVSRFVWAAGLPFYLAIWAGGGGALVLAVLIGIPTLKLKSHYFAIGTLALAMISSIFVQNNFPGVSFLAPEVLAAYSLVSRYLLAVILAALVLLVVHLLSRSKLGLGMIAIREDEDCAEAIGINTFWYKVKSLAISSFIAGVAGGLFAVSNVSFYYHVPFELWWSFDPLLISFIGGAGTVLGPVLGAVCYVVLKEIFAITLGQVNVLIFGIFFIIVVLFFPQGLIGLLRKVRSTEQAAGQAAPALSDNEKRG